MFSPDLVKLDLSRYSWTSADLIEVLSRSRRACSLSLQLDVCRPNRGSLPISSSSLSRCLSPWSSANVISLSDHRSLLGVCLTAAVSAGRRLPLCNLPHSLSAPLQQSKPLPQ
ncbi:hypothetical protein MRB53_020724 [Persea americana]|uniref:Uncharacterized protein n=1 Tax=Persea americana TaxID=3435 RepID=A0ACC2L1Q7_PERAE|nr:hypothetical protein MRB53_020724 [Persea americana]